MNYGFSPPEMLDHRYRDKPGDDSDKDLHRYGDAEMSSLIKNLVKQLQFFN